MRQRICAAWHACWCRSTALFTFSGNRSSEPASNFRSVKGIGREPFRTIGRVVEKISQPPYRFGVFEVPSKWTCAVVVGEESCFSGGECGPISCPVGTDFHSVYRQPSVRINANPSSRGPPKQISVISSYMYFLLSRSKGSLPSLE